MDYIPISMVKEYTYCPRQAYLKIMIMREPPTESMKYAKQVLNTEKIIRIIREQGIQGEIKLEVPVKSTKLGIVGRVDAVVINGSKAVVIETKLNIGSRKKLYMKYNHVLAQATAYAMAIEETMKVTVDKILIINQEREVTITIRPTPSLRIWIERAIQDMRKHIQNQELPPKTTNKAKCKACYFKDICPP
ncbi:CRISPR-associated protein Cas4 [Vulcanisaeta moutnovskia 768-28]|uniref:CRISPR-associated exonuclease Cas4 n=1 Tax=Vulcanisaeta moutnovskia (strain 768-28) TaxID=985053 RepID=F0QT14_VULM7|nr:CRISPR-associated protein Cas4 [Vulcanisaeta moutnovskia]ADY01603.1 CRISPR-associated protein Cas4 [Vulcanisaeta moutnovskia 768-28]